MASGTAKDAVRAVLPDGWASHLRDLSEHVEREDWHRAMWIMTRLMRQAIIEAGGSRPNSASSEVDP